MALEKNALEDCVKTNAKIVRVQSTEAIRYAYAYRR
jgi:hypothetical protein